MSCSGRQTPPERLRRGHLAAVFAVAVFLLSFIAATAGHIGGARAKGRRPSGSKPEGRDGPLVRPSGFQPERNPLRNRLQKSCALAEFGGISDNLVYYEAPRRRGVWGVS